MADCHPILAGNYGPESRNDGKHPEANDLAAFLDMVGPEHRAAVFAQVRADLERCANVFDTDYSPDAVMCDTVALGKTAHEVKGVAATIGAAGLADIAAQVERACTGHDTAALNTLLPVLARRTRETAQRISRLIQAA